MEGGNVDAGLGKKRGKTPDEAGFIFVGYVEHRRGEFCVHADTFDVDDAWAAVGEHGAGHRAGLPIGDHRQGDQAVVIAFRVAPGIFNHDAAVLGHDRRRDHIDVLEHRPQQARERGGGERLGVHLRHHALKSQPHLFDAGFGELPGERAELFGKRDEWLELRGFFGAD